MKKYIVLIVTIIFGLPAFATVPATETERVARALVGNPALVQELANKGTNFLTGVEISTVDADVQKIELVFVRQCECIFATSKATILEDYTHVAADGPIEYSYTLDFKQDN